MNKQVNGINDVFNEVMSYLDLMRDSNMSSRDISDELVNFVIRNKNLFEEPEHEQYVD